VESNRWTEACREENRQVKATAAGATSGCKTSINLLEHSPGSRCSGGMSDALSIFSTGSPLIRGPGVNSVAAAGAEAGAGAGVAAGFAAMCALMNSGFASPGRRSTCVMQRQHKISANWYNASTYSYIYIYIHIYIY